MTSTRGLPPVTYTAESIYLVFIQYYLDWIQCNEKVLARSSITHDLQVHLLTENNGFILAIEALRHQMMIANGMIESEGFSSSSGPGPPDPPSSTPHTSRLRRWLGCWCCCYSSLDPPLEPSARPSTHAGHGLSPSPSVPRSLAFPIAIPVPILPAPHPPTRTAPGVLQHPVALPPRLEVQMQVQA